MATNIEPTTGNVYLLSNNRMGVVGNSIILDGLTLYTILPVSHFICMASDQDFIVLDEPVFKKQTVMAELWNSLAVPVEFFKTARIKGKLSDKYVQYLSSYLYFVLQNRKNDSLSILTGPKLVSNSDIRWLFRQMENKEFHNLRTILVSISE